MLIAFSGFGGVLWLLAVGFTLRCKVYCWSFVGLVWFDCGRCVVAVLGCVADLDCSAVWVVVCWWLSVGLLCVLLF